jgi:hypothetical protein
MAGDVADEVGVPDDSRGVLSSGTGGAPRRPGLVAAWPVLIREQRSFRCDERCKANGALTAGRIGPPVGGSVALVVRPRSSFPSDRLSTDGYIGGGS